MLEILPSSSSSSAPASRSRRGNKYPGVAGGVLELGLAQLTRPVAPLLGLVERLVQVAFGHGLQRVRRRVVAAGEDLGREHRVEDGRERDAVQVVQELVIELQVVAHLDRSGLEHLFQRREVVDLEHVYDEGLFRSGELEQAHLAVAGGEGGGLCVEAYGLGLLKRLRDGGEVVPCRDQPVALSAFLHHSIIAGQQVSISASSLTAEAPTGDQALVRGDAKFRPPRRKTNASCPQ